MRASLLREALAKQHIAAIPLVDGIGGIALWIPLADAPYAVAVRAWLHSIVNPLVAAHADVLSTQPNTHDQHRVYIHVASNASGRYSALPYSLRGAPTLPMCTPIAWNELETIAAVACTAATFAKRIDAHGDQFARHLAQIGAQNMPATTLAISSGHTPEPRGRINEPPDDWPDLTPHIALPDATQTQALCDRITTTSTGDDPAAFEIAVCDAFAQLGFLATHLGGHDQADGVADALLGPLGYRIAIECKTAKTIVTQPDCAEVAKEIAELHADYGVIVGPAFSDESELLSELQTHKVTAITTADLITLLAIAATPVELRATILVPGYASDVLGDLLWQRQHGQAKRVSTIAAIVQREGWNAQRTAAEEGGANNAPHLTVDAAMLLVDAALQTSGSKQACTREDVTLAIAWLTNPIESAAITADDALVILHGEND